jgi:hypothetical protein
MLDFIWTSIDILIEACIFGGSMVVIILSVQDPSPILSIGSLYNFDIKVFEIEETVNK